MQEVMVYSLLSWPPFIFILLVFHSQLDFGRARCIQVIKEVTQEIWVYGLCDNVVVACSRRMWEEQCLPLSWTWHI